MVMVITKQPENSSISEALFFIIAVISLLILRTKRIMQDKKLQYRGYLIIGMAITFLLVGNITYTDAKGKSSATLSSIQHELGDIKSFPPLQLDFRLVGTIIAGEENSYAVIMDETTGKQGMYKLGESINEAKVLKIDKDSIIIEIEKRIFILRITGGNYTAGGSPAIGALEELPYFEPVFSETGPPVDENVLVEELPHFEPVFSETGPPVDENVAVEELPHFEPVINSTGPPVEP
jgi:hypothetical protein